MRKGFRIIDADRHVLEPAGMWEEYLPEPFRRQAPHYRDVLGDEKLAERMKRLGAAALIPLPQQLCIDGQPMWDVPSERAQIAMARTQIERYAFTVQAATPEGQLASMDHDGTDIAFLFPSAASYLVHIDTMEPALAAALAGAYNRWLADYCRVDPRRLRGIGLVSRHDPDDMVAEIERIVAADFPAVVVRPNPVKGRILSDPAYEPFWDLCERHSLAVCVHEGTHARVPTTGADRFRTRFGQHACSHPLEQMMAMLALIEGGVLERHPRLRVGFFESGCGWLPYWLWRLDELEYGNLAAEVAENVRMKPSAYFRRQCYIAVEPDEPYLAALIDFIGSDRLLFGSDFPHYDHAHDIVDNAVVMAKKTLRPDAAAELLYDNSRRFFDIG